jgi:hypothetical protein
LESNKLTSGALYQRKLTDAKLYHHQVTMEQERRIPGKRIGSAKSGVLAFSWTVLWRVDGSWRNLGALFVECGLMA